MDVQVTAALESDADDVWKLLRELAAYENKLDQFYLTIGQLRPCLWGPRPVAGALLARAHAIPVGVALYYPTFPSFAGQPALFIEDLYVTPEYRRHGVGTALLRACARVAAGKGCDSIRWWALDWNREAMSFYRAVGARRTDRCVVHSLDLQDCIVEPESARAEAASQHHASKPL